MRVFIGGVMQGSIQGKEISDQGYRATITQMIEAQHPDAEVIDPYQLFPNSVTFDAHRARQVFFDLVDMAARADVLVAYLPEASMGTALEMVRASDAGVPVVSISPLAENWFIRFLSQRIFSSLAAFEGWVGQGGLAEITNSGTGLGGC